MENQAAQLRIDALRCVPCGSPEADKRALCDGLLPPPFLFLDPIVNSKQDPEVINAYIKAGINMGQIEKVKRISNKTSCAYDTGLLKDYLRRAK